MSDHMPVKYEANTHRPFDPGDVVPASTLALAERLVAGHGIAVVPNADGSVTLVNTCCLPVVEPH